MKYEIITDSEDLLVLVVNSRVIEISHRMSKILDTIEEDYKNHLNKKRRVAEKAVIDSKLDNDTINEDKTPEVIKSDKPDSDSLGKLFNLGS